MKLKICYLVLLIFAFFTNVKAQQKDTINIQKRSQDTATQVVITLKDQSTIKGVIMAMNLEEISLKTDFAGTIIIKQNNIISIVNSKYAESQKQQYPRIYNPNNPNDLDIVKFGGSSNNNYRNYNTFIPFSNTHRYNFSNNYIGLKKNELIFNNIWLLYNGADYGLTNNLSIGGGVLFLGFGGFINVLARGQVKLNDNISIGASYNYFVFSSLSSRSNNENNFGLLSGGITFMGKKGNLSLSAANGFYNNKGYGQNVNADLPVFSISGCYDINDKTSIVSDNFYLMNIVNSKFYSFGLRIKGRASNFDFGLMIYSYDETYLSYYSSGANSTNTRTIPIPFLAYTAKIN
jgi:small nuclear ribonucleoprotein (snRNP)-like protein